MGRTAGLDGMGSRVGSDLGWDRIGSDVGWDGMHGVGWSWSGTCTRTMHHAIVGAGLNIVEHRRAAPWRHHCEIGLDRMVLVCTIDEAEIKLWLSEPPSLRIEWGGAWGDAWGDEGGDEWGDEWDG